jgi:hypothetical protein
VCTLLRLQHARACGQCDARGWTSAWSLSTTATAWGRARRLPILYQHFPLLVRLYLQVADFGFAKVKAVSERELAQHSTSGNTGTLLWRAPELLSRQPAHRSPATDAYAFGMCLSSYCMPAHHPPIWRQCCEEFWCCWSVLRPAGHDDNHFPTSCSLQAS